MLRPSAIPPEDSLVGRLSHGPMGPTLSSPRPGGDTLETTTQAPRSKEYETIYVLRPDVDADTADKVQVRVNEVVARERGKLVKVEGWGRRKLAYPVAKHRKGVYVYVKYVGQGGLVGELERNLKLQDVVLKFQTVLTREAVDPEQITVDPEEVKLARIELPPEEEERESRERALGLLDVGPDVPRHREPREDDFADDDEAPESLKKDDGGEA
jgi:small subunit ribosomal protein S6